jgi:hypothetical protein
MSAELGPALEPELFGSSSDYGEGTTVYKDPKRRDKGKARLYCQAAGANLARILRIPCLLPSLRYLSLGKSSVWSYSSTGLLIFPNLLRCWLSSLPKLVSLMRSLNVQVTFLFACRAPLPSSLGSSHVSCLRFCTMMKASSSLIRRGAFAGVVQKTLQCLDRGQSPLRTLS